MAALVIMLVLAVLVLSALLVVNVRARKQDHLLIGSRESERSEADKHHARDHAMEELAAERASREHAEAELHEARLRIVALEHRRDMLEADAGEAASRRGLFNRSSSEIPPEDTEQERSGMSRGS